MNFKITRLITIYLLTCSFSALCFAEVNATTHSKDPVKRSPKQTPRKKREPVANIETCSTRSGQTLCQALFDLSEAYDWNCRGSACESIWSNQISQIRHFIYTYDQIVREVPRDATFNSDIGRRAKLTARTICGTKVTGEPGELANLAFHENLVLPRLEQIQRRAPHTSIATCEITVR